ncbi:MAG: recombination mediator RecR [Crocinitomicaceae bacterium]|nr:recombination mediator RecR [Crocinitomicaceae bacterium]
MNIPSKHLENVVEQLASLPGIGKRTALRLALHLFNRSKDEIETFAHAFLEMKEYVKKCSSCGNISDTDICTICSNEKRDHTTICVVEDIRDILAIEATESYKGIYHVLGAIISPMDGIGPNDLNIDSLIKKVETGQVHEIIFALSATMEGDTTNFYLYKKLSPFSAQITSLSRGVSIGSELQYADEITLSRSIINRQPFKVQI